MVMQTVVERARAIPTPRAGQIYEDQSLRFLVALCSCLQEQHGTEPFFLSVAQARSILGVPKMRAWQMLQTLQFDGIIKMVRAGEKGSRKGLKAAEYRFLGAPSSGDIF